MTPQEIDYAIQLSEERNVGHLNDDNYIQALQLTTRKLLQYQGQLIIENELLKTRLEDIEAKLLRIETEEAIRAQLKEKLSLNGGHG